MLKVKNLKKIYQMGDTEVMALKGIDFKIKKNEFVAIMGPSGSGKSTLLNILGCLSSPTEGSFFLSNKDICEFNDDQLADIRNQNIGFIFQQFNLIPKLSILDNVEIPLIYNEVSRKKRRKIAKEALKKVGLKHRLTHKPHEISWGQRQRVAIARALVNNPPIILADEPTGSLDSKTGEGIMEIFNLLHDQGHTIVLITHEEEIAMHAKRIIYIHDGLIIKDEVIS